MSYDSPYTHIMLKRGEARVKSFSTASRAKSTVVTVQIEVTDGDGWALGDLLRHLHEAKAEGQVKPRPINGRRGTVIVDEFAQIEAAQQRALPAPPLRLPYRGEGK